MDPSQAYAELEERSRHRAFLASTLELLGWDELTYLPRGGVEHRGHQMAYLAGLDHQQTTDPRIDELLTTVEDSSWLGSAAESHRVNMRRWRRIYQQTTRVPRRLVEELAEVTAIAQREWAEARETDEFSRFAPWLAKIVTLKQHEADCRRTTDDRYDALLDEYEIDATATQLATLFAGLRTELSKLLAAIGSSARESSDALLRREYPIERQRIFAESMAADIGFDFHRGRLDATTHPFYAAIGPGDCRITTRYATHDFGDAFFSMLHEMGHGLYEQGLDPIHFGTPYGEAPSTGIHESQSQFWEKIIGRDRPFWRHAFPRARDVFHDALHRIDVEQFFRALNHVEPSWNRVRADAVTYDLHILIRFELERALIRGDLPIDDLPTAWNEAYARYLTIVPASDIEGCLQDGHWSAGMFGYFPVYTLGNIYAAQFHDAARRALPDLDDQLARGDFRPLVDWLRTNIYQHGGAFGPAKLVEHVTGEPPDSRFLVECLGRRYRDLYDL